MLVSEIAAIMAARLNERVWVNISVSILLTLRFAVRAGWQLEARPNMN